MASKKITNPGLTTGMTIATIGTTRTGRGRKAAVSIPVDLKSLTATSSKRQRVLEDSIQEIYGKKIKIQPGASSTNSKKSQGKKQGKVSSYFKTMTLYSATFKPLAESQ